MGERVQVNVVIISSWDFLICFYTISAVVVTFHNRWDNHLWDIVNYPSSNWRNRILPEVEWIVSCSRRLGKHKGAKHVNRKLHQPSYGINEKHDIYHPTAYSNQPPNKCIIKHVQIKKRKLGWRYIIRELTEKSFIVLAFI